MNQSKVLSSTKQQHFISQIEQKMNSVDNKGLKIFSFSILDKECYKIKLDKNIGYKISKNLLFHDLFSFDIINNIDRLNFENMFSSYESKINSITTILLDKLKNNTNDVSYEIEEIFIIKMINFLRNPFSIEKVINTIGFISDYEPTNTELLKIYNRIENGCHPHFDYLKNIINITEDVYKKWLKALFLSLFLSFDGKNPLESAIRNLLTLKERYKMIIVYEYNDIHSSKKCLLSDRSFSIPLEDIKGTSFSFNLNSNAFIQYLFINVEQMFNKDETTLKLYNKLENNINNDIHLFYKVNDLEALEQYNKNVIYQCFKNVYCSSKLIYGIGPMGANIQ